MSKAREKLDRIAWATIDQLPQRPVHSAGLDQSGRPKSFPELERQIKTGIDFESALGMFLQEFYSHRDPSFFAEPPPKELSDIERAALAGVAEYLCHRFGFDVPAWTEEPAFFLTSERNWFDTWDTSNEDGGILQKVFDSEFIVHIRENSMSQSVPEFTRRNLLFPVRGLIRV
jgi:hypothetical protein